ncbi:cation:dicarboxylate symporter family transporter [Candidatus Aquarickettsia rohweri]|uniref:Dicarboxylate/amino acid:cation symporter n=1 Tax=Candidatus Aquarickettsia rohweri TaxID=2602574 RepID=A0A429XT29_9RICK|nr:cation:dicarboxylase symporter family transporter [Candidatus Aquarickettsia rohweri]RST70342.1 dicarboxylate/amino acid:cation symporter [Candidatus Aquarickettsia rohweri]
MKKFKLPLALFFILIFTYTFGNYISVEIKELFLSISLILKSILLLILPFIIFSFITSSLLLLEGNVFKFVGLLILCIFISNSMAIYTGYFIGSTFLDSLITAKHVSNNQNLLMPLWAINISTIFTNDQALLFGLMFSIIFSFWRHKKVENIIKKMSGISTAFLKKFFIPTLPLFVIGFIFKLQHEDVLEYAIKSYGKVLIIILLVQISYLSIFYFIISKFNLEKTLMYFKNVMPAAFTGFSAISSAAAMSVLLLAMEKIFKNKSKIYKAIITAVINTHTLGSAIGITILIFATIKTFNSQVPSFESFVIFAFFYAISKFAVAAVPGGVLLIVAPLFEKYLAFSPEMIGVITVIYLLFDPFGKAVNVTGNGGFAIGFSRIYGYFNKKK